MLRLVRGQELAAGQIATHFPITQQAVSQHLQVLQPRRAGVGAPGGDTSAVPAAPRRPRTGPGPARRPVARGARPSQAHRRTGQEEPIMSADLVVTTTIEASPQEVFPYLVEADQLLRWLGSWADVDPRPGGVFAVDMGGTQVRGSYVAVEPPYRVVFTWGIPGNERPAGRVEHRRDRPAARRRLDRCRADAPGPAGRPARGPRRGMDDRASALWPPSCRPERSTARRARVRPVS